MTTSDLLAICGMVCSAVGVFVNLSVRASIAELNCKLAQLETKMTQETHDSEMQLRDWVERSFSRVMIPVIQK